MNQFVAAAVLAPLSAIIVWIVAVPIADLELIVDMNGELNEVGAAPIVVVSLLSAIAAAGAARLLERGPWTVLALGVFVVSMAGPLFFAEEVSTLIVLALMHVLVAAVILAFLRPALADD